MSWITFIWAVNAGICLAMAGMQLLVWTKSRQSWASLAFSIAALAAVGNVVFELLLMRAQTPAQYSEYLRGLHIALGVLMLSLVWFLRSYLGTGRLWLAWLVVGLRVVTMVLNSTLREVSGIRAISFLGETLVVPTGAPGPLSYLAHVSGFLFLVFAVDSAILAWRRGDRQRAWIVGVTFASASAVALAFGNMLARGTLPIPLTLSFPFLLILVGIGYGLSLELLRARQLARDLNESQERMRLATSGANVGVWDWNIVRDEVWVSDTMRQRNRLGASERLDFERVLQIVHPEDREHVRRAVRDAVESGHEFETEYREVIATGAIRWSVARGRVERGEGGAAIRIRGVSVDITERRLAEQSLERSAAFNQRVLASLDHEIVILDRTGTIIDVNDAWRAFARDNWAGDERVGKKYSGLCRDDDSSNDPTTLRLLEGVWSVLEGDRPYFEAECSCGSEGQARIFLIRAVPLRTTEGGAVVSHVNITRMRHAELETHSLRSELTHLARVYTMGQLSSAMAHELNQPLGAILRNAEAGELFLQRDPPDLEELRSILTDIKRDDQRASAVIDRMRALLKRHETAIEALSVKEMLEQTIGLARAELQARRVVVCTDVRDNLPLVRGDRVQLQQVTLNLLINAVDAMQGLPDAARRQITVAARQTDERNVEVAVSDTGPGIAPGRESEIFVPFHTSKPGGLGVGLAISQTIVQSHGGRIWVESNPDGGATFRYTLKVRDPEDTL